MKDYLFCPIQECGFRLGVGFNAKAEAIEKAIDAFNAHLETHSIKELAKVAVDYVFLLKEDKETKK